MGFTGGGGMRHQILQSQGPLKMIHLKIALQTIDQFLDSMHGRYSVNFCCVALARQFCFMWPQLCPKTKYTFRDMYHNHAGQSLASFFIFFHTTRIWSHVPSQRRRKQSQLCGTWFMIVPTATSSRTHAFLRPGI